jgi:hypothetical protein
MAPQVLNQETYYALKARIHFFNQRYGVKLKYLYDATVTEELFSSLSETWTEIAQYQTDDFSKTDLPLDLWITDENFEKLKDAVATIRFHFASVARDKELGEKYMEQNGKEATDYTNVSSEIFEICMLALHTYTNFFKHCDYWIRLNQFNSDTAEKRAKELAKEMHLNQSLHTFDLDLDSKQWIDNPFDNIHLDIAKKAFNKDNYTDPQWDNYKNKEPYINVKKAKDRAEAIRIANVQKEIEQKKLEKIQREQQSLINSENARIVFEKRLNPQIGDYSVYNTFRDAIPNVDNIDPTPEKLEHFYAFFKKLGIDEKDLSAQTLVQAMDDAHRETKDNLDSLEFCIAVEPIYRQLQAHAYEAAAKRAIESRERIDFNVVSRQVDETMAALYCTSNLVGFQQPDEKTRLRAAELINGTYMGVAKSNVSEWLRAAAIENVKNYYREQGIAKLTARADGIYNSFAERGNSSGNIAERAKTAAKEYARYKRAVLAGTCHDDKFAQGETRNMYMDHAYALERRVETRYATRWSRFIRLVSYLRQKNALAEMKKSLGIDKDRRIEDEFLEVRLNDFANDFSDPKDVNSLRIQYTKEPESKVIEHVRATLKLSIRGKNLPEALIIEEPVVKEGFDPPNAGKTVIGEMLKEEEDRKEEERLKLIEEEKAKEKERQEEIRRQNEKKEEEMRKQAILEKKEIEYQEKLNEAKKRVEELEKIRKKLEDQQNKANEKIDKEIALIPGRINDLQEENYQIKLNIDSLKYKLESTMKLISQKANEAAQETNIEKSEGVAGFFKGVLGIDKWEQKKDAKRVNQAISNDEFFSEMTQTVLSKISVDIQNEELKIKKNEDEIKELYRKETKLKQSKEPSAELKGAVTDHKAAKEHLQYLIDNKDKIVCVGENISFQDALLYSDDSFDVDNNVLRPTVRDSYVSNDGRFTVVVDGISEDENVPVSSRVNGDVKNKQEEILKK